MSLLRSRGRAPIPGVLGPCVGLALACAPWSLPAAAAAQTPGVDVPRDAPAASTTAAADVETVLTGRGKAYLEARARLESDPSAAVPALLARLRGDDLDPAGERRLHAVLAGMSGPELASEHARLLRTSLLAGQGTAPWASLLSTSPAGRDALTRLVGDRDLAIDDRGQLLEQLVDASPIDELLPMLELVGRGHPELSGRLWRALVARGHQRPEDATALTARLTVKIEGNASTGTRPDPAASLQRAKWVALFAVLADPGDPSVFERLAALARRGEAPFEVRFAALRGLASVTSAAAEVPGTVLDALDGEARRHLAVERRTTRSQRDLLLGWRALATLADLDPARASALIDAADLRHDPAPRVAALAWRHAQLRAGDVALIDDLMGDPWPDVQAAGLRRIVGPCERAQLSRLGTIAGPASGGGTREGVVGRAAVEAIGRCGGAPAVRMLRGFIDDEGIPFARRGAAARALMVADPDGGTADVARALSRASPGAFAETLADALAQADPDRIGADEVNALCGVARRHPNAARAARRTLDIVAPGTVCDE